MENYNNRNDQNRGRYFDQYVNFDQFLMQHNINNWSPHRGTETTSNGLRQDQYNDNSHTTSNGAYHFQPHHNHSYRNGGFRTPTNLMQSSNLTATASEFVPQTAQSTTNTSTLVATANVFVPKNTQNFLKIPNGISSIISDNKKSDIVSCDMDKNGRMSTKESTNENASKTDCVIEALSNTHISDGTSIESQPLNSSGGAIKKIRSQDYRNDSRDRHSNGE